MVKFHWVLMGLLCAALLPFAAQGVWYEDFDGYPPGQLPPQGGWEAWGGAPGSAMFDVTTAQARSAPHSLEIDGAGGNDDDAVHQYSGYTSGVWTYTAWQYFPSSATTGATYFILLNSFDGGGEGTNWSLQLQFNAAAGLLQDDYTGSQATILTDQWVEIRVDIDLDADTQAIYYDGALLSMNSWSDPSGSDPGATEIAAVDLYANMSPFSVYYDGMSLTYRCSYSDDLETNFGTNWNTTGFWHAEAETDTCGAMIAPFPSGSTAAYYGDAVTCDYTSIGANTGSLEMNFDVNLMDVTGANLSFMSYEQTNCPDAGGNCGEDERFVDISTDGGASWDLAVWASTGPEGSWYPVSISLDSYNTDAIRVRFRFDTVDALNNNFLGWFVDDIAVSCTIYTPTPTPTQPTSTPFATCPPDSMLDQMVHGDNDGWSAANSDENGPYIVAENFYNTLPSMIITELSFYGLDLEFTGTGFIEGNADKDFTVMFYSNNAGAPGTVYHTQTFHPTKTELTYLYNTFPLNEYTGALPTPVTVSADDWIGLQALIDVANPDVHFLWMSSGYGDAESYQDTGTGFEATGFDRAICAVGLTPSPTNTPTNTPSTPLPIPTTGPGGVSGLIFIISILLTVGILRRK